MNYIDITQAPYSQVLDGHTDNTAALQAAIAALATGGGGELCIPGPACTAQKLIIDKSITITGYGRGLSCIYALNNADITVVQFKATADQAGMRDISVYGRDGSDALNNAMVVDANACIHLRHMRIWGGFAGLFDQGVDGLRENLSIAGRNPNGSCVTSNGANWWVRCSLDSVYPLRWGFLQGSPNPGATVSENRLSQCDFSGPFTMSVMVHDGGANSADTVFDGCVFSSPISLGACAWTCFRGCSFGAAVSVGAGQPVTIADSKASTPFVVGGVPNVHLSNNIGIS